MIRRLSGGLDMFVDLTADNLATETLCCIIRTKKPHPGVECKRQWLAERLKEGHVFRKLEGRATVFIEYAPLEKAWTPVVGENYFYVYCLWTEGENRGKGYGKALLESCLEDARAQGKSGVCLLGAAKQKAWLTDQAFFRHFGFETVETTPNGYELLALSFDGSKPHFAPQVFQMEIDSPELTVYYDDQCPFIHQTLEKLRRYCAENGEPLNLRHVDSLDMAKKLPCVFNNWAAFYGGKFVTVNLTDGASIIRAAQKAKNR